MNHNHKNISLVTFKNFQSVATALNASKRCHNNNDNSNLYIPKSYIYFKNIFFLNNLTLCIGINNNLIIYFFNLDVTMDSYFMLSNDTEKTFC